MLPGATFKKLVHRERMKMKEYLTSIFLSPEQTISRSSPVPVPDKADTGSGENLAQQPKISNFYPSDSNPKDR